jgi:hypothetical protein
MRRRRYDKNRYPAGVISRKTAPSRPYSALMTSSIRAIIVALSVALWTAVVTMGS